MTHWSPPKLTRVQRLAAGLVIVATVAYSVAIVGSAISAVALLTPMLLAYLALGLLEAV